MDYHKLELLLVYVKRGRDVLSQSFNLLEALELEGILNAFFGGVKRDPIVGLLYNLYLRDRQRDTHEWVESNGKLIAIWALDRALELAVHQVYDDRLIPLEMVLPRLFAIFLIIQSL